MKEKQAPPTMANEPSNDKSRNVTGGFNMLAQMFPFINFIMFLLGWFTVPVEVLFRRNFGQRWLTIINFYAGLVVLIIFNAIQLLSPLLAANSNPFLYRQPQEQPTFWHRFMNHSMLLFFFAYLLIGSYHFFKIWWQNRTHTALHSFDDGRSRFEPVAFYLMQAINIVAVPIIRVYMLLLPKDEQQKNIAVPPLNQNVSAFTNTVFEPILLIGLALIFQGTARTWLLISAPALAIYASWKETAKLNKVLDFRDSIIEAETMIKLRSTPEPTNSESLIMQQAADTIKNNPEVAPQITQRYPDLMSIIEEMNREENGVTG